MLTIDGSQGEGGGQILRTALALSLITQQPFRITRIRARRAKPGLMRQHLTAVRAATDIGAAEVTGAALGSMELTFVPRQVRWGEYMFDVGTAGSTTLVLQTVLPALLTAPGPSVLTLKGGTHNPQAPPFDFLARVFVPIINRAGPSVTARLLRPGFFPAGGGECTVSVSPADRLTPIELCERGRVQQVRVNAKIARLPRHIAERELEAVRKRLSAHVLDLRVEPVADSRGPGNVVTIDIESEHITEVFTGFGERGVPAETVGARVAAAARRYLDAGVPVGEHLADQLVLPLALAGKGSFRTQRLTPHAETNLHVVGGFLGHRVDVEKLPDDTVVVRAAASS